MRRMPNRKEASPPEHVIRIWTSLERLPLPTQFRLADRIEDIILAVIHCSNGDGSPPAPSAPVQDTPASRRRRTMPGA